MQNAGIGHADERAEGRDYGQPNLDRNDDGDHRRLEPGDSS